MNITRKRASLAVSEAQLVSRGLPKSCFVYIEDEKRIALIKRGEHGYYQTSLAGGEERVKQMNDTLGITQAQTKAMLTGSMFGWHVPGADPRTWE